MTIRNIIYGAGIFNPENSIHRLIRRGVVMGLLALVAELSVGIQTESSVYVPVIVAVLAVIDKYLRDKL